MNESSTNRKRYPAKLSIIAISQELRDQIDEMIAAQPELSEAEIVRMALKKFFSKSKKKGDE